MRAREELIQLIMEMSEEQIDEFIKKWEELEHEQITMQRV